MAQLVARLVRNEKVRGSNPLRSTNRKSPSQELALILAGSFELAVDVVEHLPDVLSVLAGAY